jgi:diguanylate cyclase (GGDEF)-like protein
MKKEGLKELLEPFAKEFNTCVLFDGFVFGSVPFFQEMRLKSDKSAWSDVGGVKYFSFSNGPVSFIVGPFKTNDASTFDEELEEQRKKLPLWNESNQKFLENYANVFLSLYRHLLAQGVEVNRLRLLFEFSKEVGGAHDVDRALSACSQFVMRKFKLRNVLMSYRGKEVRLFNASPSELLAEQRLISHVKGGKSTCTVQNSKTDFLFDGIEKRDELPKVMVGFPLFSFGELCGHMIVYSDEPVHCELINDVAQEFGVVCARLFAFEKVQKSASEDPLTGLANRSLLQQELDKVVPELSSRQMPFSVFISDIDNFKKFNDTRGHPEGDRLLKSVADVMRLCAPKNSVSCRYGGEEFVMALPGLDQNAAKEVAEKFRKEIEKVCETTVSVGVMTCANSSVSWQMCVREADRALYRAKHLGKNRVISFLMLDKSLGIIDV